MTDYFKDNPRILCPVCKEHTFRVHGINKNGEERTYKMCMDCAIENFNEQTSKYKEGYASQKDHDESNSD